MDEDIVYAPSDRRNYMTRGPEWTDLWCICSTARWTAE